MTNEFKYLLKLVSVAALGGQAEAPDADIDWLRLTELAKEQNVIPMLGTVLKLGDTGCPEEIKIRFLTKRHSCV